MMQGEGWVGLQMMNNFVRSDLIQESNQRRLINRSKEENSVSRKGFVPSLISSLGSLIFSGSSVHRGIESR